VKRSLFYSSQGDQLHTSRRERKGSRLHRVRVDGGVLRRRPIRGVRIGQVKEALQVHARLPLCHLDPGFSLAWSHLYSGW